MKTNVVLQSADRELFGITIRQNTKGQFLSVTDLQKAYEKAKYIYSWSDRKVFDILSYGITKERVYFILLERGFIKSSQDDFMQQIENKGLISVLKGLGLYITTGRGANKSVMCDPYIWILLALELSDRDWETSLQ